MTLEEQIKALLEANEKADKEAAEKGADEKEDADAVEDEPAVKIDNPMNPDLQGEDTPEAEIEAADKEGLKESAANDSRAAVNVTWNDHGHRLTADDHFDDYNDGPKSTSVKLNSPLYIRNAEIHNVELRDGVPDHKMFERVQDYMDEDGFDYRDNMTIPKDQHVVVVDNEYGGYVVGHHPKHGFFRADVNAVAIKQIQSKHPVVYAPASSVQESTVEMGSIADLLAEDFSDEFKLKAQTIFEAAVKEQVAQFKETLQEEHNAAVAKLEEQFEDKLAQRSQQVQEELSEKIDGYLGFLAEEWKEDNIVALEAGIKSELTESFMGALKQVFESHYMEVPADKVDLYQKVLEEKADAESALSTSIVKAQRLQEEVAQFKRAEIIEESVKGLTDLDAEKLKTLVEDFEYVDAAIFEKKVHIVKTQFFEQRQQKSQAKEQLTEDLKQTQPIVELNEQIEQSVALDPAMAAYVNALRG